MPLNFPTTEDELITYKQSIDNLDSVEFLQKFNEMDIDKKSRWRFDNPDEDSVNATPVFSAAIILAIKKIEEISKDHSELVKEALQNLQEKLRSIEEEHIIKKYDETKDTIKEIEAMFDSLKQDDSSKHLFTIIRYLHPMVPPQHYTLGLDTEQQIELNVNKDNLVKNMRTVSACIKKHFKTNKKRKKPDNGDNEKTLYSNARRKLTFSNMEDDEEIESRQAHSSTNHQRQANTGKSNNKSNNMVDDEGIESMRAHSSTNHQCQAKTGKYKNKSNS